MVKSICIIHSAAAVAAGMVKGERVTHLFGTTMGDQLKAAQTLLTAAVVNDTSAQHIVKEIKVTFYSYEEVHANGSLPRHQVVE